jgi:hypothetical protein
MAPKLKSSNVGNYDMPKRKQSASFKQMCKSSWPNGRKKKKNHMLRLLRSTVKTNLLGNSEEKKNPHKFCCHISNWKIYSHTVN